MKNCKGFYKILEEDYNKRLKEDYDVHTSSIVKEWKSLPFYSGNRRNQRKDARTMMLYLTI